MLRQESINDAQSGIAKKLDYRPPAMFCYGRVQELTRSGTGTQGESNCPPPNSGNNGSKAYPCTGSDPRVKENIVRIGTHPFGIGLDLFDYKSEFQVEWGYGRQFGVMADEVETVMPEAVCVHANGYRMVDYAMLGVEHSVH
jgi:hypothetical protein